MPTHIRPLPADLIARAFREPGTVLLGSGFHGGEARSFYAPESYIAARKAEQIAPAFQAVEQALAAGKYVAGFVTFEAGLLLQGALAHPLPDGEPLLCFGVYAEPATSSSASAPTSDERAAIYERPPLLNLGLIPAVSREQYSRRVTRLQEWIAAGDLYQANLTMPLQSLTPEASQTVFEALLRQQPAPYAAVLRLAPADANATELLSFSPELFFRTGADRSILTQPMKGTRARVHDETEASGADALAADEKNRAEHIMIVDLLRNDLGRVCETGTIQTENLFVVQSLPTVHQMVSDVRGRLREGTRWIEVFRALFPSGSVTGAPKLRALECLHAVENAPRGVYTGAVGYIAPDGSSCFSVAIRTLTTRPCIDRREITLGVGGGIVSDSTIEGEYREALLKSAFVRRASKPLVILESLRSDEGTIRWIETHLDRVEHTAAALDFPVSRAELQGTIESFARENPGSGPQRLRLRISDSGEVTIQSQPLQVWPGSLRVRLAAHRSHLGDPALAHKTNFRESYDEESCAAEAAGFQEAIFANDAGLITEGCITSLFFVLEGRIFTPPLACGALPGVLRTRLLARDLIEESILTVDGLENLDVLILGNSLRGIYAVGALQLEQGRVRSFDPQQAAPYLERLQRVYG